MNGKKVSVITVAYNNCADIKRELVSLQKFNDIGEQLEIIIVDHSDVSLIPELEVSFPDVLFLKHQNLGFGSGNNFGAMHSSADILCFLNPDTYLIEPIFQEIINSFQNKKVGILGTQLLDSEFRKNLSFYYIDKNSFISKQWIKYANNKSTFNPRKMYISGANLFIRRELFYAIGCFDEKMFMYYEEPDLTKRMFEKGYTSCFRNDLHIIHLECKNTAPSLSISQRKYESAKYYCKKYGINYKKILRQDLFYNRIKLIISRILQKKEYKNYKEKCSLIKKEISKSI